MKTDTFTFLRSLPEDGLRELARACREERFESGAVVFREGDAADCLYIIVEGEVEVWKDYGSNEAEIIAHLGKGSIFGEMALVDRMPRSATIIPRLRAGPRGWREGFPERPPEDPFDSACETEAAFRKGALEHGAVR
jgi:hypothetical protein